MWNNVVLMFSPTDENTPYERGENHTVQSVAVRSIVHKFLKRSPAWSKPERVLMDFFRFFLKSLCYSLFYLTLPVWCI